MDAAIGIARGAGKVLMDYYGRLTSFDRKGVVNLVCAADHASEEYIRDAVLGSFGGDAILGEEGTSCEGTSGFRWIVDPLDGTTNFIHTHPMFCVSIGIETSGQVLAGCVYVPYYDEMFYAMEGRGAFLNGRPIRVSKTESVNDAVLASGFPYNRREIADELLVIVRRAIVNALGFRRSGSAAIDLCYVACGRCDGFWEQDLKPWDLAAGEVLVREAGGRVTAWDGGPHSLYAGRTLASNGLIHDELIQVLFSDRVTGQR